MFETIEQMNQNSNTKKFLSKLVSSFLNCSLWLKKVANYIAGGDDADDDDEDEAEDADADDDDGTRWQSPSFLLIYLLKMVMKKNSLKILVWFGNYFRWHRSPRFR